MLATIYSGRWRTSLYVLAMYALVNPLSVKLTANISVIVGKSHATSGNETLRHVQTIKVTNAATDKNPTKQPT